MKATCIVLQCTMIWGCFAGSEQGQDAGDAEEDFVETELDITSDDPDIQPDLPPDGPACGNGVLDRGEECDQGDENSDTQPDACRTDCTFARCGDGVADAREECDEDDFRGETCETLDLGSGTLGCTSLCRLDDALCFPVPPGLVWVSIPAGVYEMGCSPGSTNCFTNETPRHAVSVSAFRMTETEITQAQYQWITGSNPSRFSDCQDCPVEQVDWYGAKTFCQAIGGRLPSEAEWEYAARAGTTTSYYCGENTVCLYDIAWFEENSANTTHPVKTRAANAFGLYDTLGNVIEWVEDCWHEDYTDAPSTGEVWSGGDDTMRVIRGGAYSDMSSVGIRVSFRQGVGPLLEHMGIGLRCAQ